jgi:hypothetical protein
MNRRFFLSLMPAALAGILTHKPARHHAVPIHDANIIDPDEVARLGHVYAADINRARYGRYANIAPDVALMDRTPFGGWADDKWLRITPRVSKAIHDHCGGCDGVGYARDDKGGRCYVSLFRAGVITLVGKGPSWADAVSEALGCKCSHSRIKEYPSFSSALAAVTGEPVEPFVRICADCGKNLS